MQLLFATFSQFLNKFWIFVWLDWLKVNYLLTLRTCDNNNEDTASEAFSLNIKLLLNDLWVSERLRKKRVLDLLKWHLHGATRKGPNLILFLPSKNFHNIVVFSRPLNKHKCLS